MKCHGRYKFSSPHIHPNPSARFKKLRTRKTMKQLWETAEEKQPPYIVKEPTRVYTKPTEIGITNSGRVMNSYIPMEKDARKELTSKEKFQEDRKRILGKISKVRFIRFVKKYDTAFNQREFLAHAHHIYITAHNCIKRIRENEEELIDYVTQNVYGQMTKGMHDKTIEWEFVESMEQPKIVNAAAGHLGTKDNSYAQFTVRFHTLQKLAIYNRFGKLIYGDRDRPRYVLEYVLFEKHVSDTEGKWRIAGKITPEWKKKGFSFLHTWKEEAPKKEVVGFEDLEPFRVHRYNPEYPDEMTSDEMTNHSDDKTDDQIDSVTNKN
ncbi:39S ribosomal protein L45, mitochondrial-like isoform X2 [Ostrea edulis]|nr:39S ribosomal protein L45, mitochondrial-like isoform X2 [Ostrea edulis]